MTTDLLTLHRDAVTSELRAAQEHLAQLKARIAEGEPVFGKDLAEAEHAVDVARLRMDAVDEHERRRAEDARLERIDELGGQLRSGRFAHLAAEVVAKVDEAERVLNELVAAAAAYQTETTAVVTELHKLAPLPEGMELVGRPSQSVCGVTVDGVRWRTESKLPLRLPAEVLRKTLSAHDVRADVGLFTKLSTAAGMSHANGRYRWVSDRIRKAAAEVER